MVLIRSIYAFSCSQIRELIIVSDNPETRKGLLKIHDAFIEGSTFVYTIDAPTIEKIREHFELLEDEE